MSVIRELRRDADLKQHEFATLLGVPLESLRTWDSGRRRVPAYILQRAKRAVATRARDSELMPLDTLARELGVHERTLRAAARSGRLDVEFLSRSVFGRPIRRATRRAAVAFMERYYKKSYSRYARKPAAPHTYVPLDYARRLRSLRRTLGLTQAQVATMIGAAGKAIIYQWESEKRRPSPVFWRVIERLQPTHKRTRST